MIILRRGLIIISILFSFIVVVVFQAETVSSQGYLSYESYFHLGTITRAFEEDGELDLIGIGDENSNESNCQDR